MKACIIMHNMIVEDECHIYIRQFDDINVDVNFPITMP